MDDNKKKLYDALSESYDMGTFEQFSRDIQDNEKRRKLYDAISNEYDLPDFDGFSAQLGISGSVPAGEPQDTVYASGENQNEFTESQLQQMENGAPVAAGQAPAYGTSDWLQSKIADDAVKNNPYNGMTRQQAINAIGRKYFNEWYGRRPKREVVSYDTSNDPDAVQEHGQASTENTSAVRKAIEEALSYGVVSNPDEAAHIGRDIRNSYVRPIARQRVQQLMSNFKEANMRNAEDIQAVLDSRETQQAIDDDLRKLGFANTANIYDDEESKARAQKEYNDSRDAYYAALQEGLQKMLVDKYNYLPTNDFRSSARRFSSTLLASSGDEHEERIRGREASDLTQKYLAADIDKAFAEADKRAEEVAKKINDPTAYGGGTGPNSMMAYSMVKSKSVNEERDPQKVLKSLQDDAKPLFEKLVSDEKFLAEVTEKAEAAGLSPEEYIENYVMPGFVYSLERKFRETAIAREMPKSGVEYVLRGFEDSIIGMLANSVTMTQSQREFRAMADAATAEGKNKNVNANIWLQASRLGVGMFADAPLWASWGNMGSKAAGRLISERARAYAAEKGLTEAAARRLIEEEGKQYLGKGVMDGIMRHVTTSAITMGGAEGTTELVRGLTNGDSATDILGNVLNATLRGTTTGTAFGVTGGVMGRLTSQLSGGWRLAGRLAGLGVEAGTMYTTEELQRLAAGEEAFGNPFEGLIEATIKLGFIKASNNPMGTLSKFTNAIAHPVKATREAMKPDMPTLTTEDVADIMKGQDGRDLIDIIASMAPERTVKADGKRQGNISREQAEASAEAYRTFMTNPDRPFELKQKVARLLGGILPPPGREIRVETEDDGLTIRTRDIDGQCIRELKFDSRDEAKKTMDEMQLDLDWNTHEALAQQYDMYDSATHFGDILTDEYRRIAKKKGRGEALTQTERQITDLFRHRGDLIDIQNKINNGIELTDEERALGDMYEKCFEDFVHSGRAIQSFIRNFEDANGLEPGTIEQATYGRAKKDIPEAELEDAVEVGNGVWRTATEQRIVDAYRQAIRDRISQYQTVPQEKPSDAPQLEQRYQEGYDVEEPSDMQDIRNMMMQARQNLIDNGFTEKGIERIENDTIGYIRESYWSEEERQLLLDYINAKSAYDGMLQRVRDDIDTEVETSDALIDSRIYREDQGGDGMIHPATLKTDNRKVYIVSGHVQMMEDGTMVDQDKSDHDIIVRDAETGNVEFLSVDQFLSVDEPMDGEQMKMEARENIRQTKAEEAANNIEGILPFNVGDSYELNDEQGLPHHVTIMADNGDGTVGVIFDGQGEPQVVAKETLQQLADVTNLARVTQNREQQDMPAGDEAGANNDTAANESSAASPANPVEDTTEAQQQEEPQSALSRIPVVRDEKGQPVLKKGRPQYEWHKASVDDTADALTELSDGEMVSARDTAKSMIDITKGELEAVRKQKVRGSDPIEIAESRRAIKNAEQEAQQKVQYWQNVNQTIQNRMRDEANRRRAEIEAAKSEEQKRREAEEKRQQEERLNEIERERMREAIERDKERRNKPYEPLAKARKELAYDPDALRILEDTEPRDLEEWVSSLLRPHSIMWQDEGTERGLRAELGLQRGDMQRFMALLAPGKSGGKPFAQIVDEIYSNLPEAMQGQYTDQDVRNTLLEMFNEGSSTRMRNLIAEHRIEEAQEMAAENARRDAEAETEAWAEEHHLTPEERDTYESFIETIGKEFSSLSDEDIQNINAIFADNNINDIENYEQNRTGHSVDQKPVSGRTDSKSGRSQGEIRGQGAEEDGGLHPDASGPNTAAEDIAGSENLSDNNVPGRASRVGGVDGNVSKAEEETEQHPTDGQKEAGNYKKGHVKIDGFDITIENPKGSIRSGSDVNGNPWSVTMQNTYGYIRRTEGVDGDHIDVFLSDHLNDWNGNVFVVDQVKDDGSFDEHKVMYGFNSAEEAQAAYNSNYSEGWQGLGNITGVSKDEFKKWVDSSHRKTKPFADYKLVTDSATKRVREVQKAIDELSERYHTLAPIVVYDSGTISKEQVKAFYEEVVGEPLPDEDIEEILQGLKEDKTAAYHSKDSGKIYIFADKLKAERTEEAFFHENLHQALSDVYGDGVRDIAEAYWDTTSPTNPEATEENKRNIERQFEYNPETIKEEYLVAVLGQQMHAGTVDKTFERLSDEHANVLDEILKRIGYDRTEETRRRNTQGELLGETQETPGSVSGTGPERGVKSSIQGLENYSKEEITDIVRRDIESKLADSGIDGVEIVGMDLNGSRMRGDAGENSDLDVVVEYSGDIKEDNLFNILNEEPLEIEGIKVDINPITKYKSGTLEQFMARSRRYDKEVEIANREAGGALTDHLSDMGVDVTSNVAENRRARKAAEKDNSENGKLHEMRTSDGKVYGFTYRGHIYLDPRKLDAELPLHEYGHLWCEAFRKLNPEGWKSVVETIKSDKDSWQFIENMYPDLKADDDIAEEVISKFSGKRGADRLRAELKRMSERDPSYASRWSNIFKNISKAIQDFWKHIGDFLHIKYKSAEDVYDQVLKDFADKVNPRKKVEEYLKKRNDEYMEAAKSDNVERATEIFNEALAEEIGNGMTPFIAVDRYRRVSNLAHLIKDRDPQVVERVAKMMAPLIPDNAVLVPAPSHSGKATDMLDLAKAIAGITGSDVADVLSSAPRDSQYMVKKQGGKAIASADMGIQMSGQLPEGKIPVVIDNVVDSGNTAEACVKALGKGVVVSLGNSVEQYKHAVSLRSAEPIIVDKKGDVIPLDKRFNLKGKPYPAPAPKNDVAHDAITIQMPRMNSFGLNMNDPVAKAVMKVKEQSKSAIVGYEDSDAYVFVGKDADDIAPYIKNGVINMQNGMRTLLVPKESGLLDSIMPKVVSKGYKLAIIEKPEGVTTVKEPSPVVSLKEGSLFSDSDFEVTVTGNDIDVTTMSDKDLLEAMSDSHEADRTPYELEYDRRHHDDYIQELNRYNEMLEHENTPLDDAYSMYGNVLSEWKEGGYNSEDRSKLLAQIDALEYHIDIKEEEAYQQEVERERAEEEAEAKTEVASNEMAAKAETFRQQKEEVRAQGYDLTQIRIRPLANGENCHVERRYVENGCFNFTTGKEHIESIDDVAFIFKQLETASVENAFMVLVKDGVPTVIHVGIGNYNTTVVNPEQVFVAMKEINPDVVHFVHNHPSGNLVPSRQDYNLVESIRKVFGAKLADSIIIDTTSGKYGVYNEYGKLPDRDMKQQDSEVPVKVFSFSKQVFEEGWDPSTAFTMRTSEDVASFVSSHRLGDHLKLSLLITDTAGHVTGNVFLPWTNLNDAVSKDGADLIARYVHQMGGLQAIVYGNFNTGSNSIELTKELNNLLKERKCYLRDVIQINDSAHDNGWLANEPVEDQTVKDEGENRSLMGVHNISEEKLKKAIKQGGLANPSMAVVDTNHNMLTSYGDISLIPRSSLIDARRGKNAGTFTADAWTPTYPPVIKRMTGKGEEKSWSDIRKVLSGEDEVFGSELARIFDGYLEDSRSPDRLAYWYLKEKGIEPKLVHYDSGISEEDKKAFNEHVGDEKYFSNLTHEGKQVVLKMMADREGKSVDELLAYYQDIKENLKRRLVEDPRDKFKMVRENNIADIEENGIITSNAYNFMHDVRNAISRDGKLNQQQTLLDAVYQMRHGHQEDFEKWLEEKEHSYGVEEVIFDGYTPSGKRKYVKNTLENVSKLMKREGLNGAKNWSSIGQWIAKVANKEKTLEGIRKNKKNLQTSLEEHDAFKEQWGTILYEIANKIGNGDSYYGELRMSDALEHRNVADYVKREYGVDLTKDEENAINTFIKEVRTNFPTGYFETKFERPVYLNEFAVAVVPEDTSADVVKALEDAGLDVRTYDSTGTEEQQDANRRQATLDAVSQRDDILFREGDDGAPVFFSNAAIAVENIKQEKATPEQWLRMIEKNAGLKSGEDKWLGLSDWLKDGAKDNDGTPRRTVTKQEVMDFIRENEIQVEETEYSEYLDLENSPTMNKFRDEFDALVEQYDKAKTDLDAETEAFSNEMYEKYGEGWAVANKLSAEDLQRNDDLVRRYYALKDEPEDLAFGEMTERYGDDFGLAFEINWGNGRLDPQMDLYGEELAEAAQHFLNPPSKRIESTRLRYSTEGLSNKREIALTVPNIEPWKESDTIHFGDAGGGRAVAWARFGDAYAPKPESEADGPNDLSQYKVLVIDEIQSKRHQEAREQGGYEANNTEKEWRKAVDRRADYLHTLYNKYPSANSYEELEALVKPEEAEQMKQVVNEEQSLYEKYLEDREKVPAAPFEKNWHELAMKRMLRYAAENGYDKVAWTTGEQQADRYDLGGVIGSINAFPHSDPMTGETVKDQYDVFVKGTDGSYIHEQGMDGLLTKDQILQNFGKDIGARIIEAAEAHPDGTAEISGNGLRIGGEGMKGFYDDILPRFMNKYGKKWGVKVYDLQLPGLEGRQEGLTMHSVDVTPDMRESVMKGQPLFRTSDELNEEYGDRWLTEQTNDDGRHTTQVKNTINSYKKFADWVTRDANGKDVTVLDASSGLGLGTQWMRENGMKVDDVEPYPSENREAPTYKSYSDIDKKYDYIISNAVLNVIPDDWRAGLLHDMADKLNVGGKLVINVRSAESIKNQGVEGKTRITLDDPSEILVLRPDGSIKAYQKGFTKPELKEWCESELGDDYTVQLATQGNAGGTYDTAVVITKNNESTAKSNASELGQPTHESAPMANVGAKVDKNTERSKRLSDLLLKINNNGSLGAHELLHELNVSLDTSKKVDDARKESTDHSRYYDLGNGVTLRIADHQGNAKTFADHGNTTDNYGMVVKLSPHRFSEKSDVDYLEYVYYPDMLTDGRRQTDIVNGLRAFVETGDFNMLPKPDRVNASGKYKDAESRQREGADATEAQSTRRRKAAEQRRADAFAQRQWRRAHRLAIAKLNLGGKCEVYDSIDDVPGASEFSEKKRKAKGWFDPKTGKIVIVMGNHNSPNDVLRTILHEGVAHHGLRELFRENFDQFLDNVFQYGDAEMREAIVELARKKDWDFRTATEEYLARLAEDTDFERAYDQGWWQKIKYWFFNMLHKIGLKSYDGGVLSDNELRYILWRSYENMAEPGRYRNPFSEAKDISKQMDLKVGRFSERDRERIMRTGKTDSNFMVADRLELHRDPDEDYDAGRMTFEESITKGLIELSNMNKENVQLRIDAMKAIGGNLSKLRQAMSHQREYDKNTVNLIVRFARMLMDGGFFDSMSKTEIGRLLGLVSNAAAREDITKQATAVVDMMVNHQLKECASMLHKQITIKASKVNASGVEVQGRLDIEGQRVIAAFKEGMGLDAEALNERIFEALDKMGSDDDTISKNAETEYQGLQLAKQYLDDVKSSEVEAKQLKHELKEAHEEVKAGTMTREAYKEFERATEDAILSNKLERVEAYQRLLASVGEGLRDSIERAKTFREADKRRVQEIQHNANSDLEGIPTDEHSKPTFKMRAANWPLVRFFMKPLSSFDYILRFLGQKNVNGEGYLWNRFFGGWIKANDTEWRNLYAAHKVLDEKVSEVIGKKMKWSDLFAMERHMPMVDVEFWDGGQRKSHKLTQGNLLYIYMANKMTDGRMKLRKMGITEEDIEAIKQVIDPRFITLADWLQDVFLKEKRNDYNVIHERLFGAPMAAIDNYFPLKINSRSRGQEEEISEHNQDGDTKPATITGSIIKRTKNAIALDVTGADAFDVVLQHLQDMEHWAAFAELNRDMNTLLSYKRFRNRVLNMSSIRFGSGKQLWQNLKDVCAIAAGVYHPMVSKNSLDSAMVNIAKGVTAAKISFRVYTALKQFLSYPAYLSEASILNLAKYTNPVGAANAWNWSMDELPGFSKRWQSRQAGDNRLRETDVDWGFWKNRMVATAGRLGMTPNAFVDGMTVAMGAKAIYETKLKRYKKDGLSEDAAKEKALRDASALFNETQQSNENAFLSPMQLDRTVASVALTVFRNASMGYQRKMVQSMNNLKRKMKPGYKAQSIEFMKKQMNREGLDEEQAERVANRTYMRSWYKDIANVVIFGFVMQLAWNLGPYMVYLLAGDDDEKKDEYMKDAMLHAIAGGLEGLSGGNVISDLYNMKRSGEDISNYNFNLLPLMSDLQTMLKHFKSDEVAGWNDLVNLLVQSGVGVNPQTITDAFVAIEDMVGGDPQTGVEVGLLLMRILQVPKSQQDEIMIDEIGLNAKDAQKLSVGELAQRYATFKRKGGAFLTQWAYGDEARQKVDEKYIKRFMTKFEERLPHLDDEELESSFNNGDEAMRKSIGKYVAKEKGVSDTAGGKSTSKSEDKKKAFEAYKRLRDFNDMAEDVLLDAEKKKAMNNGDEELAKDIERAIRDLKKMRDGLGLGEDDTELMNEIRKVRSEILRELQIAR